MKAPDFYLNNYIADELRAAFDKEDVCISYSGDYEPETLNQVHNSCEILFVEEGEAEYQVNDTVYHVEKNTVLIIGATDRHKFTFTKLPYIRYGLTLMPSFLQSLPIVSGYMNVYQTQIPENAAKLVNLEPSVFQRMIKILWELRDEWESGEEGSDMVCALVMELTILLKRQLQMKSQESSGTYKAMNELKHYIDTHYQEDLSLSNLSKIFYLQPGTISKNFRQIWGKNINRYINSVRITNAVHILDKSDISITELAEMVEQNAPGKAHTSNHFAEYETLGFDYLKAASGFVDYPGIGFYPGYGNRESMGFWKTGSWYMKRIAETGKPMWCIEFVTGGFGIHHAAMGMNRMYAFWCLLHRMQMMLGWTWRSMLNGEEQYLTGMLNHDGRPNENYREYQWIASDFRKLEKYGFPYLPQPEIAVSYSYDSELMAAYAKMQYRMPYSNNLAIAHRILEERNLNYNVVDLHQMTEQYQILIIPGEIVMDHEQENTVREFVKNGGTAIMTGNSAWVKETGQVFDTSRPGNLTDVFGIEIVGYQRTAGMEVSEKEEQKLRRNPANGRELLKVRNGLMWIIMSRSKQQMQKSCSVRRHIRFQL